jgi:hypothetical protein
LFDADGLPSGSVRIWKPRERRESDRMPNDLGGKIRFVFRRFQIGELLDPVGRVEHSF